MKVEKLQNDLRQLKLELEEKTNSFKRTFSMVVGTEIPELRKRIRTLEAELYQNSTVSNN